MKLKKLLVALPFAVILISIVPVLAVAVPQELRVLFVNAQNQPIPKADIGKFVCRDLIDEPILVTKTVYDGLGTVILPDNQPVEVCARIDVPGFGEVVMFADNNRMGYTEAGTIDFITEAAITRLRRVESALKKATAEGVVMPQSFYNKLASAATLPPYPSLALSMAAGEEVAMAIARNRINHYTGPRSGFLFGCATFGHPGRGATYDVRYRELFNYGTTNMYLTGYAPTELPPRNYSRTDLETDWLLSMGMTPKTCPPFYLSSGVVPQWLKDKTWPDIDQICHDLIEEVCQRYAGKTPFCEITNEATFSNGLGLTMDQIVEMTATASTASREGDPNIQRMINSSTIWGDTAAKLDKFGRAVLSPYAYLSRCIAEGIDFEITGLQGYYPEVDLLEIDRMLERYASLGKPIHITEMGCSSAPGLDPNAQRQVISANWHGEWSESVQADWVESVYSIFYSKPYIDAVSWWDFADVGSFWPYGGLCRGDLSPKLSYTRLQGLLQQWGYLDAGNNCTCKVTAPAGPTNQTPLTFSIDFGKSVTGLTAGEIVVTGGTKGALTGSARSYRLVVTPSSDGNVTCRVPANAAQDPSGNNNTVSNTATVAYARLICTVSAPRAVTNHSPIDFTMTFSGSVTGLTAGEINVTGGTKGTFSGSGAVYTISVTPSAGTVTLSVPQGAATDSLGRSNALSNTAQVSYDASVPSCVVASSEIVTSKRLVDFTLDFSELVEGFTMDDIVVTGATKVELIMVGAHNILTVAPTGNGVVSCRVPAGVAMDAGENPNSASNTASFIYNVTPTIQEIKLAAGDVPVDIDGAIVSASFPDFFYIETDDRSCGIRVDKVGHTLTTGMRAHVVGMTQTDEYMGERFVNATTAVQSAPPNHIGTVTPLCMNNKAIGGGTFGSQEGIWEWAVTQNQLIPTVGLNNIGLLVKVYGQVTVSDPTGSFFYIDDGSDLRDGMLIDDKEAVGVPVYCEGAMYSNGQFLTVIGVSSCYMDPYDYKLRRLIRVQNTTDINIQ